MNIRLSPHSEELLKIEMARGRFRSPEEVVERALEALHDIGPGAMPRPRPTIAEFRRLLDALAEGSEKLPNLPTSAFSRANIYRDHP